MQKIGIKDTSLSDSKLVGNFKQDVLCNTVMELSKKTTIHPRLIRKLSKETSSILENKEIFFDNGNINKFHSIITNERGSKIFLLLDNFSTITEIAEALHRNGKKTAKGEIRSSVKYWIDMFIELQLIMLSKNLSKHPNKIYEKIHTYKNLIDFTNYLCLENLKRIYKKKVKGVKDSLTDEILNRSSI